jgi:hypothetical protein
MKTIPLFKIDDLVMLYNEMSANPSYREIFVGKIKAIRSRTGRELFFTPSEGETQPARIKSRFTYSIHGYSLANVPENELLPYKPGDPVLPLGDFKRELKRWHATHASSK